MNYISTRNNLKNFTFKDVFLKGLADDGGLYIPKSLHKYNQKDLNNVWNSGADIAVIGTAIEEDFNNILLFDKN